MNTGKISIFLNSPAFALRENARKLLKTQEYTIILVRLPNGERWKICVFLNSLEFTFLGKYKKTGENFCERKITLCFPYVNRAVNSGELCFPKFNGICRSGKQGKMPVFNCKPGVNVEFYTGKTSVNTGKQDIRQVLTDR